MTDTHQTLMDAAYDRWQAEDNNWSREEFYDQLDAGERLAVFAGNFNYQVCNGGFEQWDGNGYASEEVVGYLIRLTTRMDTETSLKVRALLRKFARAQSQWNEAQGGYGEERAMEEFTEALDPLDTAFYKINDQFLAEVEDKLNEVSG